MLSLTDLKAEAIVIQVLAQIVSFVFEGYIFLHFYPEVNNSKYLDFFTKRTGNGSAGPDFSFILHRKRTEEYVDDHCTQKSE